MLQMRKVFHLLWLCLSVLAAVSCGGDNGPETPEETIEVTDYIFSKPSFVFGFTGQNRYSYCPSIVANTDGTSHVFFCGNPNQNIMVDNVYHIVENANGTHSPAVSVLQPSLSWDSHHTCDPSVIEGQFKMDGTSYKYALFFLSNPKEYYYNEIGVAFSNDLNAASWVKYPVQLVPKTWPEEGDQSLGGNAKSWGVGQPSAVSLDKKGKVLLTYTIGDSNGTRVVFREMDLSDMSRPGLGVAKDMNRAGLDNLNGASDYTCNCDFAIAPEENKIVMVRPVQPHPGTYPAYIPVAQEVDYMDLDGFLAGIGRWTALARIDADVSSFPRNHNAGLSRDSFGHVKEWETPTVYFTVSKEAPDVNASTGRHAEWTYHIYKTKLTKRVRTVTRPKQGS